MKHIHLGHSKSVPKHLVHHLQHAGVPHHLLRHGGMLYSGRTPLPHTMGKGQVWNQHLGRYEEERQPAVNPAWVQAHQNLQSFYNKTGLNKGWGIASAQKKDVGSMKSIGEGHRHHKKLTPLRFKL